MTKHGDPDRILALLWRHSGKGDGRPVPGRKPKLTVDDVVAAAVALADAEGLAAVSMNRVATALGVGTMTLYTYAPSKADLVDLMVDALLVEKALPGPGEARPVGWRAQVRLYADVTVAQYRAHPWLRHVSVVRPPVGPGMLADSEYVLSTVSGLGLVAAETNAAAESITAFVLATAALEADAAELERTTAQTNDSWWHDRDRLWQDYFDPARYPTMNAVWHAGGFDSSTHEAMVRSHAFGLARLLDGIELGRVY
ncbi:TetR/AcrR family transcriptional regulator [Antrihabitans sp. YC2-6]|uniref:TetR/AcrR family transcriptional regulator n=1 Tax=Antrihabitans sp. YC2-6 TaxID=2799498 RepID=UPI0018F76CD3|nr:TetR/AcrR family transcriptional regulator [Antrihabitans sp. YC2-6]MBJ8344944.1 TetR/AcrR family transcriptional regulator C-terminal domain-containing protein [Antrihabitans sp. YC2-6]